ncbi:uncharacterized protein BDZ99DRAFT_397559 [Mytilinidion resinicola]|uniref:Uncharacterized protein n=1 Tax=Mytilinidion resinicola TaxID=574789 RepID=A0A6A6Y9A8_9PEZI|nr:uncharacterized protein BDZ99DRAFT_397559 [Mytilinidion resinicola]KAF2804554.1 hypothetical protein BDZ99DRAFT_397559 [Mytilinidion resinicola]
MISSSSDFEKLQSPQFSNRRKHSISANIVHWAAHVISVLIIFGLILNLILRDITKADTKPEHNTKAQGVWTPADDALGDTTHTEIFQNSFWEDSPYKGPPTEEILARWHHITHTGPLNITREEMEGLELSTDAVQYPEEFGGGYVAYLESAHQLHCLQALWEDHHWNTKPHLRHLFPVLATKLATEPDITEAHFEHCVDVLRNRLMCTADASLVTFRWVKGVSGPYPYFNTKHECRSYEGLLGWDRERRPGDKFPDGYPWPKPDGVSELERAP